jgi:hypothetical protein
VRPDRDDPLAPAIRRTLQASRTDCPDAEAIAAYAERSLANSERRGVELHLSSCARCRETLLLMSRAAEADTPASSSPRFLLYRWPWLAGAAAAGVAIVIWLALPPAAVRTPESDRVAQVASRADAEKPPVGPEQAAADKAPAASDQAKAKAPSTPPRPAAPASPAPQQPRDRQAFAEEKRQAGAARKEEGKLDEASERRARVEAPAAAQETARPAAPPAPASGPVVVPTPGEGARPTRELLADNRVKANASIQGPELERFLQTAAVVTNVRPLTNVQRLTLQLDGISHDAAWSVINNTSSGLGPAALSRSGRETIDSWRHACAAYELDKLLGLGMVPATIERVISGERGSVTLWIENAITEQERRDRNLQPPDPERWSQQVFKARLFDNLIANIGRDWGFWLITDDWNLRLIRHSWSFGNQASLRTPEELTRFSRSLLEAMARLDEPMLREKVGRFITVVQIRALLERRDLLLELAKKLASERGEAVYFP